MPPRARQTPAKTIAKKTTAKQAAPRKNPAKPKPAQREEAAALMRSINAKKGYAGSVVLASQQAPPPPRLSTGSLSFDAALGGGWPMNNWTQVIGKQSSGKTTTILKTLGHTHQFVNPDFYCWWVAAEPFDAELAEGCGVNLDLVHIVETNIMEDAYQWTVDAAQSRGYDMLVIDSYPALSATAEDQKDMEGFSPGLGAARTTQFIRKMTKAGKRSLTDPTDRPFSGFFVNQWREQIGVTHGDPRIAPGGKHKDFWVYATVDMKRDEWLPRKQGVARTGQAIKMVVEKMKGAKPKQVGVTDYYFAHDGEFRPHDYDTFKALLSLAETFDVISRSSGSSGSFITPSGESYRSRDALIDGLRNDAGERQVIERTVLDMVAKGKGEVPTEVIEEPDEIEDEVYTDPPRRELKEFTAPAGRRRKAPPA